MRRSWRQGFCLPLAVIGFLLEMGSHNPAGAQTFKRANTITLRAICSDMSGTGESSGMNPNSNINPRNPSSLCPQVRSGQVDGPGANSPAQIQAETVREKSILAASKEGGGGSADTLATSLDGRLSTFLLAGAASLRHQNNDFEEGYHSTIPSVTLGADYRVTDAFGLGVAFNYYHWDASIDDGGGFDVNAYSPLLSLYFLPFDRVFANVVLGYARQNNARNRQAELNPAPGNPEPFKDFKGFAPGNTNSNQYSLSIWTG